jgi:uncharacterized protein (DUF4415 family)
MRKRKLSGARKWRRNRSSTKPSFASWVDPDDAPELTKEHFERADWYRGDKLVRRGRPPSEHPKEAIKLRLDHDVLVHFRATGRGWQTRINAALRWIARLASGPAPRL